MNEESTIRPCDLVGNFGKYQFVLIAINIAASSYDGYSRVLMELLAPSVSLYWDWEASNPNKSIFKSTECKMDDILEYNKTSNLSNSSSKLIYESLYSYRTITEELNMICERSWLVSFSSTLILFGSCVGGLLFGRISEKYGRKKTIVGMAALCFISNIFILFSQGYVMFLLAVTLYGATFSSFYPLLFFQVLEMTPSSWTEYIGLFSKTGHLLGQMMLVFVAWILENWFYTQVFHTVFTGAFLVSLIYTLESPIWLAVRGRYDESKDTINRIIVRNGLDPEAAKTKIELYLEQMKRRCQIQSSAEKGTFSDLFKNRTITIYTFATTGTRTFMLLMYNSLIINTESFGSGMYVDLTISNVLAAVALIIAGSLLKKFSMRILMIFLCLCSGTMCILYIGFSSFPVAKSALITLARGFMSPSTILFMVYVNQIIPTSVRGVSAGLRAAVAGAISAIAPFTKELGESTAPYVPFVLFAVCAFGSAGFLKVLPETRGKELAHTVDELVKRKRDVPNTIYTVPTRQYH